MNYKICRIETLEELIEEHRNISQKVSVYEFDETSYTLLLIEINKVLKENQQLKEQLQYITSGEYYNQLRFERNMLQDLMYNSEIPKEYKELVDYTHRNTELLGEKQELIDYLKKHTLSEEVKEQSKDFICGYNFAIDNILSKIEKE